MPILNKFPSVTVAGGGGGPTQTESAITTSVDYNDGSAVDPPVGTRFVNQAEVDAFLVAQSATNFKHIDRLVRAFPHELHHNILLNTAVGIHRPSGDALNESFAWELESKMIASGASLTIAGPGAASYTALVGTAGSPLSITSFTNASFNPSIDVSGTPFTGLTLDGYYAITSTGQVAMIHAHDTNTLFLTSAVTGSPTTVWVGKPSMIMRNSLDDATPVKPGIVNISIVPGLGNITFRDLTMEMYGGVDRLFNAESGSMILQRIVFDDQAQFDDNAIAPSGRCIQANTAGAQFFVDRCSLTTPSAQTGNAGVINNVGSEAFTVSNCYFRGGIFCRSISGYISINDTVFESVGDTNNPSLDIAADAQCSLFGFEKRTEFRNSPAKGAVILNGSQMPRNIEGFFFEFFFEYMVTDSVGPGLTLDSGSIFDLSGANSHVGIIDGSGNADVGIEFRGVGSHAKVTAATDVTGSSGDIRMADADIVSYTDLATDGPYIDENANTIGLV